MVDSLNAGLPRVLPGTKHPALVHILRHFNENKQWN